MTEEIMLWRETLERKVGGGIGEAFGGVIGESTRRGNDPIGLDSGFSLSSVGLLDCMDNDEVAAGRRGGITIKRGRIVGLVRVTIRWLMLVSEPIHSLKTMMNLLPARSLHPRYPLRDLIHHCHNCLMYEHATCAPEHSSVTKVAISIGNLQQAQYHFQNLILLSPALVIDHLQLRQLLSFPQSWQVMQTPLS